MSERRGSQEIRKFSELTVWKVIWTWSESRCAREQYECAHCGESIYPGDTYLRETGRQERRYKGRTLRVWYTEKTHENPGCYNGDLEGFEN